MKSFSELIETIGYPELAKLFGVPEVNIRVMKSRDSIPRDYWFKLIKAGHRHNLKLTWKGLEKLRASRFETAA